MNPDYAFMSKAEQDAVEADEKIRYKMWPHATAYNISTFYPVKILCSGIILKEDYGRHYQCIEFVAYDLRAGWSVIPRATCQIDIVIALSCLEPDWYIRAELNFMIREMLDRKLK